MNTHNNKISLLTFMVLLTHTLGKQLDMISDYLVVLDIKIKTGKIYASHFTVYREPHYHIRI